MKALHFSLRAVGFTILCATPGASKLRGQAQPTAADTTGIHAFLFYSDRATFSVDVIDNPDFVLRNAIIGEGSAEGPSDATFVTVTTHGPPGESGQGTSIQLVATAGGRPLLTRTVPIGVFSEAGIYVAGFWINGTGCEPVTLRVRLIKGTVRSATTLRRIPFACGE